MWKKIILSPDLKTSAQRVNYFALEVVADLIFYILDFAESQDGCFHPCFHPDAKLG